MKDEKDKLDNTPDTEEQEIDLLELARKLWDSRKLILKFCLVGVVVGLVVAFSIPKEYTTSIKLAPWPRLPEFQPVEALRKPCILSFIRISLRRFHSL